MIYISTHGGEKIGMGHLHRACTLALGFERLKQDVRVVTCSQNDLVGYLGLKNLILSDEELIKEVKANDIVIFDRYNINQQLLDCYESNVNVGYVDDLGDVNYECSFVINGNLYASHLEYSKTKTQYLGIKYTILKDEYFNNEVIEVREEVQNILITFGGSDPFGLTMRLLPIISKITHVDFHIVVGPCFSKEFTELEYSNLHYYYNLTSLREIFLLSDMAITAAGSTVYELIALGIPMITVEVIENQKKIAKELHEKGLGISIDKSADNEALLSMINRLINDYKLRSIIHDKEINIFSGNSVDRLCREIVKNWN
jgi:spore coat polysaccharide biosynthesis predicted glycosyltransferase SpsG